MKIDIEMVVKYLIYVTYAIALIGFSAMAYVGYVEWDCLSRNMCNR